MKQAECGLVARGARLPMGSAVFCRERDSAATAGLLRPGPRGDWLKASPMHASALRWRRECS
eukprot:5949676-Alexandrium_andersonii.AAC.1